MAVRGYSTSVSSEVRERSESTRERVGERTRRAKERSRLEPTSLALMSERRGGGEARTRRAALRYMGRVASHEIRIE